MSREARSYIYRSIGLFAVLQAMLAAAIIWWPAFAENIGSLKKLAAPLPMLGDLLASVEKVGVEGYVIGQHYFKGCNTMGVAAAILFAMGAVAGEVHRGTLEQWIARPVSRTRLLTERYLGGICAVSVPVVLTSLSVPMLLTRVDETMAIYDLMLCAMRQSLFLGVIYSLTFLLSAMGDQPLRIAFFMLFATTFEFGTYFVETVTDFSIFRMVDMQSFLELTREAGRPMLVDYGMLLACGACFALSLYIFKRRTP